MSTMGCAYATGIYKDYIDVTIKEESSLGSQWYSIVDGGTVDFFIIYGRDAVNAIATVTAIFKKDPWCLIAHPNSAIKILADFKGKPIYGIKLIYLRSRILVKRF